jgi:hypothetical protein
MADLNQADETLRRLRPQDYPQFSVAFEIASTDEDRIQAFAHYQEAFGAKKISEFSPGGGLHIMMEINGFEILLHPSTEKKATSGMCCQLYFDNEDALRKRQGRQRPDEDCQGDGPCAVESQR